jgi:hypothetical protein
LGELAVLYRADYQRLLAKHMKEVVEEAKQVTVSM